MSWLKPTVIEMNIHSLPRILRRTPIPLFRQVGDALNIVSVASEYAVERGYVSTPDLASPAILRYEETALGSTRVI